MAKTGGRFRVDDPDPGEPLSSSSYHLSMRETVHDFYPALPEARDLLEDTAIAEFKVLEVGEPREEVRNGEETGSAYSHALLRGENPNDDPALVREQWEYARDYFIYVVEKAAMTSAVNRRHQRFKELEQNLLDFTALDSSPADAQRLAYLSKALPGWRDECNAYLKYAALDAMDPVDAGRET
jgi:hypothetical protein